jgi:hypothetical protein
MTAAENPFRTSRLLALPPVWDDASPEALIVRWQAAGRRGAFLGPQGTGKSARLRALAARLAGEGWQVAAIQWHDDGASSPRDWRDVLRGIGPRSLLCLDGAENLGLINAYRLRRYARRAGGALATLHRPSRFWPVLARHTPDAELFVAHAVALEPGCEAAARRAFTVAGGNAHEAFRRLYFDSAR